MAYAGFVALFYNFTILTHLLVFTVLPIILRPYWCAIFTILAPLPVLPCSADLPALRF